MTDERNLERVLKDLDECLKRLEEGSLSLEESFEVYKKGMEFLAEAKGKIDLIEKKMQILDEEGERVEF